MNEAPYSPPGECGPATASADLPVIRKKMRFWFHGIWISIGLVVIAPMIGLCLTVIGMRQAFSSLGGSGVEDPAQLSAHIGEVLITTATGLVFAIIGIPALIVSSMQYRKWKNRLRA